ncbi:hypothetical protein TRFO_09436 [Tritrichomonas foetus]|uniref:Surface antigen BspA-like n=1 Tax=Tritrichomonas foetus TaxID=1144522 RepID=A0A1J4JJL6_9EUKA|nr:hypothetical protein TRFO_09436 [Tritrichomonas foetus]|eukprot:OHS97436.1 hypothetical protein TRFO_09436 [Tritrichomonas foetus]
MLVAFILFLRTCDENIVITKSGNVDYVAPLEYEECDSKTLEIGEGIILIGMRAFYLCSNLQAITLPSTLQVIKNSAFMYCTSLTSVVIPEGVETLEENVFRCCTSMASLSLPSTISSIQIVAFQESMTKLTDIQFPNGNPTFSASNGMIYTDTILMMCSNAVTEVNWWPPNVKELRTHCFVFCKLITEIILPSTLETLGSRSLYSMTLLTSLELGTSIKVFNDAAVELCSSLQSINVAESNPYFRSVNGVLFTKDLTELLFYPIAKKGDTYMIPSATGTLSIRSFSSVAELEKFEVENGNTKLKAINGIIYSLDEKTVIRAPPKITSYIVPDGIETIGVGAFYTCRISSISFPPSVSTISESAFHSTIISSHITIPDTVEYIGSNAFYSLGYLPSVTIECQLTSLSYGMFINCHRMTSCQLPNSIITIEDSVFNLCSKLENINIPPNLRSIGKFAFYSCLSLPNFEFPKTLESIGASAFESCLGFTQVTIPARVSYVPQLAFSTCTNTKLVIFESCNTQYHSTAFYSIPDFDKPQCISSKTFTTSMDRSSSIRSSLFLLTFLINF